MTAASESVPPEMNSNDSIQLVPTLGKLDRRSDDISNYQEANLHLPSPQSTPGSSDEELSEDNIDDNKVVESLKDTPNLSGPSKLLAKPIMDHTQLIGTAGAELSEEVSRIDVVASVPLLPPLSDFLSGSEGPDTLPMPLALLLSGSECNVPAEEVARSEVQPANAACIANEAALATSDNLEAQPVPCKPSKTNVFEPEAAGGGKDELGDSVPGPPQPRRAEDASLLGSVDTLVTSVRSSPMIIGSPNLNLVSARYAFPNTFLGEPELHLQLPMAATVQADEEVVPIQAEPEPSHTLPAVPEQGSLHDDLLSDFASRLSKFTFGVMGKETKSDVSDVCPPAATSLPSPDVTGQSGQDSVSEVLARLRNLNIGKDQDQ